VTNLVRGEGTRGSSVSLSAAKTLECGCRFSMRVDREAQERMALGVACSRGCKTLGREAQQGLRLHVSSNPRNMGARAFAGSKALKWGRTERSCSHIKHAEGRRLAENPGSTGSVQTRAVTPVRRNHKREAAPEKVHGSAEAAKTSQGKPQGWIRYETGPADPGWSKALRV
jgi:hypothetical protein